MYVKYKREKKSGEYRIRTGDLPESLRDALALSYQVFNIFTAFFSFDMHLFIYSFFTRSKTTRPS